MNIVTFISLLVVLLFFLYFRKVSKLKIIFISKNNFGAHMSEVTLFWGGFGCYNKKLSSRIKCYFQE